MWSTCETLLGLLALAADDLGSLQPAVLPDDMAAARRLRNQLLADPYRPTYHLVIPEDYAMPFDPNGAIYWRGRYHLCYIYQEQGMHCFGHVSSLDLVHWRQHRTPLHPTAGSPDRGMFSGNCFLSREGEAVMLFHGVGTGNCLATSSEDELDHWTKLPTNPIVPNPTGDEPYASWDPCGWLEGETYYALFGGQPGQHPKPATVFRASALDDWHYVGPFLHHDMPDVQPDEDISCPDLFTLGGKRVLICISHNRGARYYVGEWRDEQFHPELHERLSWVDNLYFAPESCDAPDGRRIVWAWIFDQRSAATREASGWSGEMALPRELWLGPDHRLRMRPVAELQQLRYAEQTVGEFALAAGEEHLLPQLAGNTLELELRLDLSSATQVGVTVCRAPAGKERTVVTYDAVAGELRLDTTHASLGEGTKAIEAAPFMLAPGELLTLRIFVDRSVVEVFANDRQAVVRRIYPTRPDSLGVSLSAEGGTAQVLGLTAWRMAASNAY